MTMRTAHDKVLCFIMTSKFELAPVSRKASWVGTSTGDLCPRLRSLRFHVCGAGIQWVIKARVVKRQCAGSPTCRQMRSFAVTIRWTYNRVTYLATTADHSGECHGRTARRTAFRETVRRPARLVEGNRGAPRPRWDGG